MSALGTVLSHAESERDKAAGALRRAEDHARRQRAQADQLAGYRGDYQRRWSGQFSSSGGSTMDIVHCYQSFTQRLDEALTQQHQLAEAAAAQLQPLRDALQAAEVRVAGVKKLIERRQAELRRSSQRRDQRQTDDDAQQARARARAGASAAATGHAAEATHPQETSAR